MDKKYHENEIFNKWISKAIELVDNCVDARDRLSKEEIEELRVKVGIVRLHLSADVLGPASNIRSKAELAMDAMEGPEFMRYFKAYSGKEYKDANKQSKKMTASIAESAARKAMKAEGEPFYKLKETWLYAKDFESQLYQIFKALDQISNSLAAVSKI